MNLVKFSWIARAAFSRDLVDKITLPEYSGSCPNGIKDLIACDCRQARGPSDPEDNIRMATTARPPCDEAAIRSSRCSSSAAVNGPWTLAATILGMSMAFIDGTVVNVALPALQSALHATISDVQWVIESYALFLAALLLIGGVLGDLYGRRKVFTFGVAVFSAASALCGCSPDIRWLIIARGVQGVGGALLVPGSLALISANFLRMSAVARSEPGPGSPP